MYIYKAISPSIKHLVVSFLNIFIPHSAYLSLHVLVCLFWGWGGVVDNCWTIVLISSMLACSYMDIPWMALKSVCVCVCAWLLSHVQLLATPWTVAHQRLCPWNSPGKILEWVAISSRGSSRPSDRTRLSYVTCIGRRLGRHLGRSLGALTALVNSVVMKPPGRKPRGQSWLCTVPMLLASGSMGTVCYKLCKGQVPGGDCGFQKTGLIPLLCSSFL